MAGNEARYAIGAGVADLIPVTPSDTVDLTRITRGIYVGAAGDVKVRTLAGIDRIIPNLAAGIVHPIPVKRIWATNTVATSIMAVY